MEAKDVQTAVISRRTVRHRDCAMSYGRWFGQTGVRRRPAYIPTFETHTSIRVKLPVLPEQTKN